MTGAFTPLMTAPTPWSIEPIPSTNANARSDVAPSVTMLGVAVKLEIDGIGTAVTETNTLATAPAAFVTFSVYWVVVELGGVTVTATPSVMVTLPGVSTPVPPEKTPVIWVVPPSVTIAGLATRLVIVGNGTAWAETIAVTETPAGLITVNVYTVVAESGGVTTAGVPLATAPTPLSIVPVPFENVHASEHV